MRPTTTPIVESRIALSPSSRGTASASPPPNELDRFVQAVACAPNDSRAEIRDTIGGLSDRAQIASLLRHNVILD